jgi:hypothetical protein
MSRADRRAEDLDRVLSAGRGVRRREIDGADVAMPGEEREDLVRRDGAPPLEGELDDLTAIGAQDMAPSLAELAGADVHRLLSAAHEVDDGPLHRSGAGAVEDERLPPGGLPETAEPLAHVDQGGAKLGGPMVEDLLAEGETHALGNRDRSRCEQSRGTDHGDFCPDLDDEHSRARRCDPDHCSSMAWKAPTETDRWRHHTFHPTGACALRIVATGCDHELECGRR